jgi:hypothetical protein
MPLNMDIISRLNTGIPKGDQSLADVIATLTTAQNSYQPQSLGPITNEFNSGNAAMSERIQAALAQSDKPVKPGIVDKISPFLDALAYIADRTSKKKFTRGAASGRLRENIGARQGRLAAKDAKAKEKLKAFLSSEEFMGNLRAQKYEAAAKSITDANLTGATKAELAMKTATTGANIWSEREAQKATTERVRMSIGADKGPTQAERLEKAAWDVLSKATLPDGSLDWTKVSAKDELLVQSKLGVTRENPYKVIEDKAEKIRQSFYKIYADDLQDDPENTMLLIEGLVDKAMTAQGNFTPEQLQQMAQQESLNRQNQEITTNYLRDQEEQKRQAGWKAVRGMAR